MANSAFEELSLAFSNLSVGNSDLPGVRQPFYKEIAQVFSEIANTNPLGWYDELPGEVGVQYQQYPYGDVRRYGAAVDIAIDDQVQLRNTVTSVIAIGTGEVIIPGIMRVSGKVPILANKLKFKGNQWNVCGINFDGSAELFEIGTDDGLAWDAGNYSGYQGNEFQDLHLQFTGIGVPLNHGLSSYGAGTFCIRDWRGGSCRVARCTIRNFDYGFWGVQSDLDQFDHIIMADCHSGTFYLGPRSDQATFTHCWGFHNDVVFRFEGSAGHRITHWITDDDGSATTCPVTITASAAGVGPFGAKFAGTRNPCNIVFEQPWLESLVGHAVLDVPAFFDVCNGDAVQGGALVIRDPFVIVQFYNTPAVQHVMYLVRTGNVRSVIVEGMSGKPGFIPWNNLRAVFQVLDNGAGGGATTPYLFFSDSDITTGRLVENNHTLNVKIHVQGDIDATYTNNVVGPGPYGPVTMFGPRNAPNQMRTATAAWTPGNVVTGTSVASPDIPITGLVFNDTIVASLSRDLQGMTISAHVKSAGIATAVITNLTGVNVNLAASTVRLDVTQH